MIGIVGPSGSGKSTFLTMAGALQTPSSGEISINDKKITHMKQPELAKVRMNEIGFVLQATNLVPFFDSEATICSVKKAKNQCAC
ncbi:ABC transporter ATP-binding protein [Staphylococcus gallinarum]|uniref:ABC transporter ATP-binding protein n=1 Tax=Staphylococcus gallinarum TaxID=1293 RepID=A0A380FBA6_STAGA|nr:ABC transporter ATP-binding protein [Staphylococcus gallinarum]